MTEQDKPDPAREALTTELIRREALRRAATELARTAPGGVESVLARISAEVTAEAAKGKKAER
ncbi:hypothetical protein [Rhodopila sp.]|uniref:hypothetical protein n=1 Tax=Rhodopila sp. TaxID=2480087 RepID=UPI003D0E8CA3